MAAPGQERTRELVDQMAKIIHERKAVRYDVLSFLMGRSPTWSLQYRFIILELHPEIGYEDGVFYVKEGGE